MKYRLRIAGLLLSLSLCAFAQPSKEDYDRALSLGSTFSNKVLNKMDDARWLDNGNYLFYKTRRADSETFYIINTNTLLKKEISEKAELDSLKAIAYPKRDRRTPGYWAAEDDEKYGGPSKSPNGEMEAFIQEENLFVRYLNDNRIEQISRDGSQGEYYSSYIYWSPDSKNVALMKIRPAEKQYFHMIESAPADQLQGKLHKREYRKPGSALPFKHPHIFNIETKNMIKPSTTLFENPFSNGWLEWNEDGKAITFEYNQRGHQIYRMLEVNAENGSVRTIVEDSSPTFIVYNRIYRNKINNDKELIWSSERDNHNHLYLYDMKTGKIKNQITKGEWYVRDIVNVDEENKEIIFSANGVDKDEDPYHIKYYKIGFNGKNMVCLTPEKGNHTAYFSPDRKLFTDTYSQVNVAPVSVLKSSKNGEILSEIEKADITPLENSGWKPAEPFVAKGRDGKTDIWGIIVRPTNFDENKSYPVLEYIYAGPGSHYVPKNFMEYNWFLNPISELGFIVVMIDGMGTSYRSKAFEDVTYQNLYDAGLQDRMIWIKEAAGKYPYMNAEKVGIYGGSAGGQNAMAATLQYPEFYKAAYSGCGCHDNRVDKIWWNELWMGYPIGPHYEACSNVVNAHKLQTPLMLMVGELDDNVDPISTLQVADALIKANKDFDLLFVPGAGHQLGNGWAERKRMDFFVKHLQGFDPPKWY